MTKVSKTAPFAPLDRATLARTQRRCAQIYREVVSEEGFDPTRVLEIVYKRMESEGHKVNSITIQKWANQFGWMRMFLATLAITQAPVDIRDVRTLEAGIELMTGLSLELINVAKSHLAITVPETVQEVIDLSMAAVAVTKAAMETRMQLINYKPALALNVSDAQQGLDVLEGKAEPAVDEAKPDLRGALAQFEKARKDAVEH